MIRLIRSGIFRLIKSKGFWIIFGLEIAALALFLKLNIPYEITFNGETEIWVDGVSMDMYIMIVNIVLMIAICFWISGIVGENFSSGTISHKLTAGNSRLQIFFAELISVLTVCLALYVFFYGFSMLFCLPAGDEYFRTGYYSSTENAVIYSQFQELVNYSAAGLVSTMGLCSLIVCMRMCWQSRGADIIIKLLPFVVLGFGFVIYQLDSYVPNILLTFPYAINLLFLPTPYLTDRLFYNSSSYPYMAWRYAIAAAFVIIAAVVVGVLCINRIDLHLPARTEEE